MVEVFGIVFARGRDPQCETHGTVAHHVGGVGVLVGSVLELQDRVDGAAAGAASGEREGAGHRSAAGEGTAIVRRAGKDNARGRQQRDNEISRTSAAEVFKRKIQGDRFAGINHPVGWGTVFGGQRHIGQHEDRGQHRIGARQAEPRGFEGVQPVAQTV